MELHTIDIDLGKTVFHLVGLNLPVCPLLGRNSDGRPQKARMASVHLAELHQRVVLI
jgi:hypothetical protein